MGVLADLGVSSPQLDRPERGFSFRLDGPLDMRMNSAGGETAAELIDRLEETDLADLIYAYGEERLSRRIARRIVEARPWQGSSQRHGRPGLPGGRLLSPQGPPWPHPCRHPHLPGPAHRRERRTRARSSACFTAPPTG